MSHATGLPKAGARATAALAIGLTMATLGPVSPASAVAPAGPTGLNVAQPLASTTKFNWNRSAGADRYEIQVDDDLSFATPEVGTAALGVVTVNSVYVPEVALKPTTNYWRVRAVSGVDKSEWVTGLPFDPPQVTVPIPSSPVDGAHLQQPNDPPLLSWTPSPGAKSYTVEVAPDPDFVTQDDPPADGDDVDRRHDAAGPRRLVLARDRHQGSRHRLRAQQHLQLLDRRPGDPDHHRPRPAAQRVAQRDRRGPGLGQGPGRRRLRPAGRQQHRLHRGVDRGGPHRQKWVYGTRFSPPVTYANNGYYWRVRAVDTAGKSSGWARSQVQFNRQYNVRRSWSTPPTALDVPDPLYFDWKAVTHASEYEIWVGSERELLAGHLQLLPGGADDATPPACSPSTTPTSSTSCPTASTRTATRSRASPTTGACAPSTGRSSGRAAACSPASRVTGRRRTASSTPACP